MFASDFMVHHVPIECINQAAITYHIPAALIITVLHIENGKIGMKKKNKDGSYDYGPMQINSRWLKKIQTYGYTEQQLQYNPCINVSVGAWILASRIGDSSSKDFWTRVAHYHSYTPEKNQNYQKKILSFYQTLENALMSPL